MGWDNSVFWGFFWTAVSTYDVSPIGRRARAEESAIFAGSLQPHRSTNHVTFSNCASHSESIHHVALFKESNRVSYSVSSDYGQTI